MLSGVFTRVSVVILNIFSEIRDSFTGVFVVTSDNFTHFSL